MENSFNLMFQRDIEGTYLLTRAMFSSGRNQPVESLCAFDGIITKEELCQCILGPER